MRALWLDIFMGLDEVTNFLGNLGQPDEKIQFEIFSWLQLFINFDEILTMCLSY